MGELVRTKSPSVMKSAGALLICASERGVSSVGSPLVGRQYRSQGEPQIAMRAFERPLSCVRHSPMVGLCEI